MHVDRVWLDPHPRGSQSRGSNNRTHISEARGVVSSKEVSSLGPAHSMIWGIVPGYVASKPRIFLEVCEPFSIFLRIFFSTSIS